MPNHLKALSSLLLAALLTACGGGGGGSPESARKISNDTGKSEEVVALEYLNDQRQQCGFGALNVLDGLNRAAKAHAEWSVINNQFSHAEDQVLYPNGFTGASVVDRVSYQNAYSGAAYFAFESIANQFGLGKNGEGARAMASLLNSPYHASGMLDGYRDVGAAVRTGADIGVSNSGTFSVFEFGHSVAAGKQMLDPAAVAVYPCEASTTVPYLLSNETPNPVEGRDLAINPLGTTIYVKVRQGQDLVINSISVVNAVTNQPVTLRAQIGGANGTPDRLAEYDNSMAFISADAPMAPSTVYNVSIQGSNNGVPFTKAYSFKTASYSL